MARASGEMPDASTLIAEVARQVLAPLGVKRKGRSRTWLDDHGWWLGIVEFQPSNWRAGSYLNVAPMFLWRPTDHLALEGHGRIGAFSPADDADGFRQAIQMKAVRALDELATLRKRFSSVRDVTTHYQAHGRALSITDHTHLGTAWGLLGEMTRCRDNLDEALQLREQQHALLLHDQLRSDFWQATAWLADARKAAANEGAFRTWTLTTLNATRAALKLPQQVPLPDAV